MNTQFIRVTRMKVILQKQRIRNTSRRVFIRHNLILLERFCNLLCVIKNENVSDLTFLLFLFPQFRNDSVILHLQTDMPTPLITVVLSLKGVNYLLPNNVRMTKLLYLNLIVVGP